MTLAPTEVSGCLGFGSGVHHVTVDRRGRLLVTDEVRGIVEVSAATGARTVIVPVETLGGPPRGIAHEAGGDILVSVQTTPPRLLRIDADTGVPAIVTEGGFLVGPTGLDVTPDGTILVADQSTPTVAPIPNRLSLGALVRVDPATGAQTRVAADPFYEAPQAVAYVGGDSAWIVSRGLTLRSAGGAMTITRLSDGATAQAPVGYSDSKGVALLPGGRIAYSGCGGVSGDCFYPYVAVYGGDAWLSGYMGTLTVVPEREAPKAPLLAPATPNPFATGTTLGFSLAQAGAVELAVYSVDGRRVATLVNGSLEAGFHQATWDGTDARGRSVRSGMYYARLSCAEGRSTRALALIR